MGLVLRANKKHVGPAITIKAGQVYDTNKCGKCRVIEYKHSAEIYVEFPLTGYQTKCQGSDLRRGNVKDLYYPNILGVAYLGEGKYRPKDKNNHITDAYNCWRNMLTRCYDEEFLRKNPSYLGCIVCGKWLNFQNFAEWYYNQPKIDNPHLDKDIKVFGNKTYSPKFCSLIPESINTSLKGKLTSKEGIRKGRGKNKLAFQASIFMYDINVYLGSFDSPQKAYLAYKKAKEKYVAELAVKYKKFLNKKIYNNLINFNIEDWNNRFIENGDFKWL